MIFPSKILTSYKYVCFNPEILLRQQILFNYIDKSFDWLRCLFTDCAAGNNAMKPLVLGLHLEMAHGCLQALLQADSRPDKPDNQILFLQTTILSVAASALATTPGKEGFVPYTIFIGPTCFSRNFI